MPLIRDIHQRFWRLPQLPWLELRTTSESRQAYKRHSHPQLSLGAIIAGETRCISNRQEYLLRPGELILISRNLHTVVTRATGDHAAIIFCISMPTGAWHSFTICRRIAACIPRSHSCRTHSFSSFISRL